MRKPPIKKGKEGRRERGREGGRTYLRRHILLVEIHKAEFFLSSITLVLQGLPLLGLVLQQAVSRLLRCFSCPGFGFFGLGARGCSRGWGRTRRWDVRDASGRRPAIGL